MITTSGRAVLVSSALAITLLGGCACNVEQPPAEPAPAPVAAAPAPAPQKVTETFSLSAEQLFDFDKSTLRPEGAAALDTLVEKYRGNARLRTMSLTGHTDSVGSDEYNQGLSERRANSVRDYLVEKGVDGSKISASGRGESSPAATNDTAEGRQQNRRVDVSAELEHEVTR